MLVNHAARWTRNLVEVVWLPLRGSESGKIDGPSVLSATLCDVNTRVLFLLVN